MLFQLFATVLKSQTWMCDDQRAPLHKQANIHSWQSRMALVGKITETDRAIETLLVHLRANT